MIDNLLNIPVKRADGLVTTLNDYSGKVILIVNVASNCGLTKQYEALEKLFEDKREEGLIIAAFPANDFREQEPGSDADIVAFCTSTYDVQFPIFSKISVKGAEKHPLYKQLIAASPATTGDGPMRELLQSRGLPVSENGDVLWNFEKFLLGRNGKIVARFAPDVTPDDPRLVSAVATELARA